MKIVNHPPKKNHFIRATDKKTRALNKKEEAELNSQLEEEKKQWACVDKKDQAHRDKLKA